MTVHGHKITPAQIAAARSAMAGTFTAADVERALERAGVDLFGIASVAAQRLMQDERKAGRVIAHRIWRAA